MESYYNKTTSLTRDKEIHGLYSNYLNSNYEVPMQTLEEIIENVSQGELGGFTLRESVIAVLKAMLFNAQHTLQEKIDMANEAMENREWNPEQQEAIDNLKGCQMWD